MCREVIGNKVSNLDGQIDRYISQQENLLMVFIHPIRSSGLSQASPRASPPPKQQNPSPKPHNNKTQKSTKRVPAQPTEEKKMSKKKRGKKHKERKKEIEPIFMKGRKNSVQIPHLQNTLTPALGPAGALPLLPRAGPPVPSRTTSRYAGVGLRRPSRRCRSPSRSLRRLESLSLSSLVLLELLDWEL